MQECLGSNARGHKSSSSESIQQDFTQNLSKIGRSMSAVGSLPRLKA